MAASSFLSTATVLGASCALFACIATDADLPPDPNARYGATASGGGNGDDPASGAATGDPHEGTGGANGGAGQVANTGNVPIGGAGQVGTGSVPIGGTGNFGTGNVPIGGTGNVGTTGGTGNVSAGGTPPEVDLSNLPPFDAGTDPLRNQVQAGYVCDRLAVVQCAGEEHCCVNPGRTRDTCYQEQLVKCQSEVFLDEISLDPVAGYDLGAAEIAFTEFENRASQCDPTIASWGISIGGLRGVTRGTRAAGDTCTPPFGATTAEGAAAHVSCSSPASHACLPSSLTGAIWSCDPRQGDGQHCLTDINCLDGSYCINFGAQPSLTDGVCAPRKPNGSPCSYGQECQTLTCAGGACAQATTQTAYCLR